MSFEDTTLDKFRHNLERVRDQIREAALSCGRPADSVRLVGVTKYVSAETTARLFEAGCHEMGENRPQVLWEKGETLRDLGIVWHQIGHLQTNKVKRTLEYASLIQSVDSLRLLKAINDCAREAAKPIDVLLEVNVSNDAAKHGFAISEMESAIEQAGALEFVRVNGLMCMAGLESDEDAARREFASLRAISESLQTNCPGNCSMTELSMGMSGDFELAIKEGATIVRIGSLLFE